MLLVPCLYVEANITALLSHETHILVLILATFGDEWTESSPRPTGSAYAVARPPTIKSIATLIVTATVAPLPYLERTISQSLASAVPKRVIHYTLGVPFPCLRSRIHFIVSLFIIETKRHAALQPCIYPRSSSSIAQSQVRRARVLFLSHCQPCYQSCHRLHRSRP